MNKVKSWKSKSLRGFQESLIVSESNYLKRVIIFKFYKGFGKRKG